MFQNFLNILLKKQSNILTKRIEKEAIVQKYWFYLGGAIICGLVSICLAFIGIIAYETKSDGQSFGVNLKNKSKQELVTLPYPTQSLKIVSSWLIDAITAIYSFDFNNYDEQVKRASYYFTPEGYATYLNALETNKIRTNVVDRKLQITVIPMQRPTYSNGGQFGNTVFWRFKMPALVSYYGGKDPVIKKMMIEVLVIRTPPYKNPKGLAITEFNMSPI